MENWIKQNVYLDSETGERRTIILDDKRNKLFFFAEPLDFDKDDQKVARYWLHKIEGWREEWFDEVVSVYTL
jgi:hypothetical protein|tara:strand:+ start:203 stop:418 length:216 start_codon:yes stop_codon:yes gene_type:complete